MYISVLSRYLIKTYLVKLLMVLLVVGAALILSNVFDLLHRIRGISLQLSFFLQLAFLKIPYLTLELLPLISMLTTFSVYFALAKSQELFVIWGAGVSVYRMLLPLIFINIVIGVGSITILNPIATYMLVKFETLEGSLTDKKIPYLTFSNIGVMVAENYEGEHRIYVAKSVIVPEKKILNLSIFFMDSNNNFQRRIEASHAYFGDDEIILYDVSLFTADNSKINYDKYNLPSSLKETNLVEGVMAPDQLTLWELPEIIYKLSSAGFPTFKHQIYYYKLLFKPLMIVSYIFLATCFIAHNTRNKNNMHQLALGILIGLTTSIISQVVSNILAYNGINIMLAVLLPIIIITLVSNFVILHWRKD